MDLEITKKDGSTYRLSKYGIVKDIIVSSPEITTIKQTLPGRPGSLDFGSTIGDKKISVVFKFKNYDSIDYAQLRDEIYGFIVDTESYYIREMRAIRPLQYDFVDFGKGINNKPVMENSYVDGKRYEVRLSSISDPEQDYRGGEITIEYITAKLPYAETVYTTIDIHNFKYSDTADLFGYSDGINDEMTDYIHKTKTFSIWNGSNVEIEPELMPLKIQLRDCVSNGNLTIRNKTTGQSFVYYPKIDFSRHYTLEGMAFYSATLNVFRDTNMQMIGLAKGENVFEVTNCTYSAATFEFRFYYK